MKTKLLFLFLLFASYFAYSQQYIFGKVTSEFDDELTSVIVINTKSEEKVYTDRDGNFMITAKVTDELRFVKQGFERTDVKLSAQHFTKPVNVSLRKSAHLIPEVNIAFQPTGNIEKDTKRLDPPRKTVALNNEMRNYMKAPPTTVSPKLVTPSAFSSPDFSAGSVNLLGVAGAVSGLIGKATNPLTTPNYAEVQAFYREVKKQMNYQYYFDYGLSESEIDAFLIYAEDTKQLAKRFRKNFNFAAIDAEMKIAFREFMKIRKVQS